MIKWIPTGERLPTDQEHIDGVVALWVWPDQKPSDYELEMTPWKPHVWGQKIAMPTHWAFLTDFDLPATVAAPQ